MSAIAYADRDLYWDAERRTVLEESDTRQAWLCINKGAQVTEEWLKATKCTMEDGKIVLPAKQLKPAEPPVKEKHWKDMNKAELEAHLTENGVDFASGATKAELVEAAAKFHEDEVND